MPQFSCFSACTATLWCLTSLTFNDSIRSTFVYSIFFFLKTEHDYYQYFLFKHIITPGSISNFHTFWAQLLVLSSNQSWWTFLQENFPLEPLLTFYRTYISVLEKHLVLELHFVLLIPEEWVHMTLRDIAGCVKNNTNSGTVDKTVD